MNKNTDQQTIDQFIAFLKATYPLPKYTRVSINVQNPEDFEFNKSWLGACKRISPKNFRIAVKRTPRLKATLSIIGHEYKHALQWTYEGMNKNGDDAKIRGLGYQYQQWEIPATHFGNAACEEFEKKMGFKLA